MESMSNNGMVVYPRTLTFVVKEYAIRKFGTKCFGFLDTDEQEML